MNGSPLHIPVALAEAISAAQPSDVEFLTVEVSVHGTERLKGITRTGYEPTRILGEPVPDFIKIVYVHQECQGRSEWYVLNWMKQSESSRYVGFDVASDEEARSAVLGGIKEWLRANREI